MAPIFVEDELADAKEEIRESGSSTYIAGDNGILWVLHLDPDIGEYTFTNTEEPDNTYREVEVTIIE